MRMLLAAILLLTVTAPARAGDASLYGTWVGYKAQLDYFPSDTGSTREFRRALRRFERIAGAARRELRVDAADSAAGAKARTAAVAHLGAAVASTRFFRRHLIDVLGEATLVESGTTPKPTPAERRAGKRLLRRFARYGRLVKRADRAQERADRLFADAL